MTFTIDVTDGWGLSNEVHHELLPKKDQVERMAGGALKIRGT